jgi:hypothetical protein
MFCHDECSFFVVPEHFLLSFRARARNPVWMLRFAQHDKRGVIPSAFFVIPSALFCHSERSEESSMDASLRLRSVQHDKRGVVPSAVRNPVHGCFASLSMTSAVSFRALFFVIPSESEESSAWMLHFAYAPFSMTRWCHSERSFLSFRARARNPVHGCFASLSMTSAVSFRALFFVIPSESEESRAWMLRFAYAPFSMTSAVSFQVLFFVIPSALFLSFRARARNPVRGCFASPSMTSAVSFRTLFFVIPSESEESSMDASLRLRSVQHDKRGVIPSALFCHSERERGIPCMDASLRPAPQGSHVEYFCCLHSILIINTT